MQDKSIYSMYRLPSRIFFGIFTLCACSWASRYIRLTPSAVAGSFEQIRNSEWPIWLEHYAAALGVPSLFVAVAYWAMARPDPKKVTQATPIFAFFAPILLGVISAMLYAYGEFGHESEQFMLVKKSNYGQHVASHCLPANTIDVLADCTRQYVSIFYAQGIADLLGSVTFIVLLAVTTWWLAKENVRLGTVRVGPL